MDLRQRGLKLAAALLLLAACASLGDVATGTQGEREDRKSTRLNSSH